MGDWAYCQEFVIMTDISVGGPQVREVLWVNFYPQEFLSEVYRFSDRWG